ncbi:SRPBCC domain-containing protein [Pseudorhodoplanes sp.]|uniref:SRPBCC family protein n=1 Tax=Pseudorhodoplanes sp. TaxID=1934341 RepID=UPI002CAD39F3|nr:SRPBCC domain-containing protein [Pseudorhodoplanes sp.]HWV51403.1 SRPBCC domain-containing protein [Pseudorhodoplanes sp.]
MSVARADTVTKPSLTLKRRLNAPAEKVYAAWTDPQKIVKWFGPDSGPVTKAEIDLRVGGRFDIGFHTEDGEYHQVGGIYRVVEPNKKLVFTWAWHTMKERESQVTITIKPDGDGSILTLLHEKFFDETARDGHSRGWNGSLDKLEQLFA